MLFSVRFVCPLVDLTEVGPVQRRAPPGLNQGRGVALRTRRGSLGLGDGFVEQVGAGFGVEAVEGLRPDRRGMPTEKGRERTQRFQATRLAPAWRLRAALAPSLVCRPDLLRERLVAVASCVLVDRHRGLGGVVGAGLELGGGGAVLAVGVRAVWRRWWWIVRSGRPAASRAGR